MYPLNMAAEPLRDARGTPVEKHWTSWKQYSDFTFEELTIWPGQEIQK
jgi:hypothetical protein